MASSSAVYAGAPLALAQNQSVVAIGAHSDDIELGCGGTLAKACQAGLQVTCLLLTHSAYHQIDGKDRTAELAESEGLEAAATLGIHDVRCLGFATTELRWEFALVEAIDAVLREVKPSLIFTHWPFDTHQDHHFGAMATLSAARLFPTVLTYEPIFPSGRSFQPFRPQLYFDIGETIEAKLESLRCHRSQHAKYGDDWLEAVKARARIRGYDTGVTYAEAFEVVRMRVTL